MSLTLQVDGRRWTQHLSRVQSTFAGLVPVIKGNGYGFGQHLAAHHAARLGVDVIAVGVVPETADAARSFPGRLLLLEPWDPGYSDDPRRLPAADRLILTASRPDAVRALARLAADGARIRVVLEGLTSMRRFGLTARELADVLADPTVGAAIADGQLEVAGLSLHLPLAQPDIRNVAVLGDDGVPDATGRVREVIGWAHDWARACRALAAGPASGGANPSPSVWVSHLEADEAGAVRALVADVDLRHRIGTRLWLGDRAAYAPRSTVLAVHDLAPGTRVGYRQRRVPRRSRVLVVAGGTAHGIALTAPSAASTVRQRVVTAGTGALDATGRALSPFTVGGKRLWFAEPPHAQVSMLWLPESVPRPAVGHSVDVEVRMTTARFDQVVVTEPDDSAPPP